MDFITRQNCPPTFMCLYNGKGTMVITLFHGIILFHQNCGIEFTMWAHLHPMCYRPYSAPFSGVW